ncbi:GntR family transcriptional regulator [Leucobacter exalbidus]|uniref:GntR family transcriptional regulator n=1 Tax=Leucobacter exalbidus TaxID=662960 RepID=A0A940PTH7_9MICO|nr:GntR family transcriptional regulator [Leucobacter exalbidus]MBP1326592.1 GntR family transcriptional regulator [Leucobacter exalbidus]
MTAKYRDIASRIGTRIHQGEFSIGSSLPAEMALASEFAVSRSTIRSALALLERKGVVAPVRGTGWVIRSTSQTQGFAHLMGFAQWAQSRGMQGGGEILERVRAHPSAAEARDLRISTRDHGYRVLRVRTLDARIVMLERTYFPEWLAGHVFDLPVATPSIVQSFGASGVSVALGRHLIDSVAANSVDATTLGVRRSSPLTRVRHVAVTQDGRPLWSNDDRYVPGTIVFEVLAASQLSPGEAQQ